MEPYRPDKETCFLRTKTNYLDRVATCKSSVHVTMRMLRKGAIFTSVYTTTYNSQNQSKLESDQWWSDEIFLVLGGLVALLPELPGKMVASRTIMRICTAWNQAKMYPHVTCYMFICTCMIVHVMIELYVYVHIFMRIYCHITNDWSLDEGAQCLSLTLVVCDSCKS